MKNRNSAIPVQAGSGNVFDDLALPESRKLSMQAELSRLIYLQIKRRGLSQTRAASQDPGTFPNLVRNGRHVIRDS